jgi:hypothetical protein
LRKSEGAAGPELRTFELGFTLAVVAMALGNLYGSPFFDSLIMSNFWILCGLLERYGSSKEHAADVVASANLARHPPAPMGQRFPLAARALPGLARARDALR